MHIRLKKYCLLLFILINAASAFANQSDSFYKGFVNPPAQTRPFARWWWISNCVNKTEILRELDILKEAGFGGIEINPIGIEGVDEIAGDKGLVWLSPEWNQMLKTACQGAHDRGMIADLIVGAGWPFGGKFLEPDQRAKRLVLETYAIKDADDLQKQIKELFLKYSFKYESQDTETNEAKIDFIKLIPNNITKIEQVIDLTEFISKDRTLSYSLTPGDYTLACGILQRGYMNIASGAPGAEGPIMDHYKKEVMTAYLKRLEKIEIDTGVKLNKLVKALFCDSIELKESNWSDDFAKEFKERCGYDIEPWLPFVSFGGHTGDPVCVNDPALNHKIERVRYDYSSTLIDVFLKNFVQGFQDFCTKNEVLCRYQAYGYPWLIGISEG